MLVRAINYRRKGNQRPIPPYGRRKEMEGVSDCLRAVKSCNLILQQISTLMLYLTYLFLNLRELKRSCM